MTFVRPITLNFTEPMVFLLNLYIALIYGLLYIWFESFPIVFVEIYGFSLGEEGLAFLGLLVGTIALAETTFSGTVGFSSLVLVLLFLLPAASLVFIILTVMSIVHSAHNNAQF